LPTGNSAVIPGSAISGRRSVSSSVTTVDNVSNRGRRINKRAADMAPLAT